MFCIRFSQDLQNLVIGSVGATALTGTANTAVGIDAMTKAQRVGSSVAFGRNAMYWVKGSTTTGGGNVAIGADAMKNGDNPTVGVLPPGTVLGSPTDCTAVGNEAGRDWQGIVGAVAIGRLSQGKTTTGTGNTSVGDTSLRDNLTGQFNTALGYAAAGYNITGSYNVAVGQAALYHGTAGSENVTAGTESYEFIEGSGNVGLGHRAGRALTSGNDNIMIGRNAGTDAEQKMDATNSIAIGANTYTTADNQMVLGNDAIEEIVIAGVAITPAQLTALLALLP